MDVWGITVALSIDTSVVSTKELRKTTLKESGRRRTSWLFTSEAEDLNTGLPRANRAPIIPAYVLKPRGKKNAQPASGCLDYCRNTLALI